MHAPHVASTHSRRSARIRLAGVALVLLAVLLASGCGGEDGTSSAGNGDSSDATSTSDAAGSGDDALDEQLDAKVAERNDSYDSAPKLKLDPSKTYTAKVSTSKGDFEIELLQKEGSIAAANFVALARDGFFDGVKVHRIVKDFVIQMGDPLGTGTGGPGYEIQDDKVDLPYKRGIVAMANAGPNTGGSQFFVVLSDKIELPPNYAIFGRVATGQMDAVDAIADTPVEPGASGEPSSPTEVVRVTKVVIEER